MSHNVSDRASKDHLHWSRNAHRSSPPEPRFRRSSERSWEAAPRWDAIALASIVSARRRIKRQHRLSRGARPRLYFIRRGRIADAQQQLDQQTSPEHGEEMCRHGGGITGADEALRLRPCQPRAEGDVVGLAAAAVPS